MRVRFQSDADLSRKILRGVKRWEPTVEFALPDEVGIARHLDDQVVLAIAADYGRILITHDETTMITAFRRFIETRESPGVFIIPQECRLSIAIESLLAVWGASETEEWVNQIRYLPM